MFFKNILYFSPGYIGFHKQSSSSQENRYSVDEKIIWKLYFLDNVFIFFINSSISSWCIHTILGYKV